MTYQSIPAKKLIVFSIAKVINSGEECTFERLVKECFDRFPKKFSFYRYPNWPDSLKLDRPIRDLRDIDGFIEGNNSTRFKLTSLGMKYVKSVTKEISLQKSGRYKQKEILSTRPKKEEKILRIIKQGEEFLTFQRNRDTYIPTEPMIKKIAFSTEETPTEKVKLKLKKLIKLAKLANENELTSFFKYCIERL